MEILLSVNDKERTAATTVIVLPIMIFYLPDYLLKVVIKISRS